MKPILVLALLVLGCKVGWAADRFEPGLWRSTAVINGKTTRQTGPRCISQQEADAMNGPAASVRKGLETSSDWKGCQIHDVLVDGNQVDFSATCADASTTTSRTTYQGSSYVGMITVPALAYDSACGRVPIYAPVLFRLAEIIRRQYLAA
ncbi:MULTISPECIES: DUF3617 family protein [unclassified Beijerinckia]|uniref:DUF3617 domain-containing protein n=1 Tax=unclassified Beijerinckia TaxID=2638183 RepID=UPI00089AA6D0|nr:MULTISPECIES: DUF3617 family protein [unclassified Beijerinckia]MDH7794023.1 hypothetical protein [Beijerinckia sp. GAS462]SEB51650.1 Protein of unknown function [Beijerinckia sp. 28-YEA-48]